MEDESNRRITAVEIIVTYINLGWALILLTNPTIFKQSENFRRIELIAQYEWVVGIVCLALAVVKIIGIALHHRRMRWMGLMASTGFWVLMSASFLFSGGTVEFNTGFIVYSGLAVLCLLTSKEVVSSAVRTK